MRPTDVPDQGLLCDLLWSDPDKDTMGWGENDRGVSFTFGAEVIEHTRVETIHLVLVPSPQIIMIFRILIKRQVVNKFLQKNDFDLICRAHQVVEDGYEFFAKRQLVTLFSAPNYCGEFDNAGNLERFIRMATGSQVLTYVSVSSFAHPWPITAMPVQELSSIQISTYQIIDSFRSISFIMFVVNHHFGATHNVFYTHFRDLGK